MGLELTAIPLAFVAGMLSILSPCIWPLVPVVMSSAASSGHTGPLWLALGREPPRLGFSASSDRPIMQHCSSYTEVSPCETRNGLYFFFPC